MPFQRKTLTTLISEVAADIASALQGADAMLRFTVLQVVGKVQAAMSNGQFGYLDWISKMSVPFTAEDEYLQGWAALKNVYLKEPTAAVLQVSFTGTPGAPLNVGSSVVRGDGTTYTTNATVSSGRYRCNQRRGNSDGDRILGEYRSGHCDDARLADVRNPVGGSRNGYLTSGFSGSLAVTVGVGGIGAVNSTGSAPGSSSVGSILTCPGGVLSAVGSTVTPGTTPFIAGGTGQSSAPTGTYLYAVRGGQGYYGAFYSSNGFVSGQGGSSQFGSGAPPVSSFNPGTPSVNYGAGGSGSLVTGGNSANAGGNGKDGIVIIREYA